MNEDGKKITVIDLDFSEVRQDNIKTISKNLKSKNTYEKAPDYRSLILHDKSRKNN